MKRLTLSIAAGLAALPLLVAAQTVNAPGGQAATALPPDVTSPNAGASTAKIRAPRKSVGKSMAIDRNTEPGIVSDSAVRHGPNVGNVGQTQPRGSVPDTPTKRAE